MFKRILRAIGYIILGSLWAAFILWVFTWGTVAFMELMW